MRVSLMLSTFLILALLNVRCWDSEIAGSGDRPPLVVEVADDLSEDITIGYGHTILIEEEGLFITFESVMEGRCPTGAACFWEGQASTDFRVWLSTGGRAVVTPVIRPSSDPETSPEMTDEALGYSFTLLRLDPYPQVDIPPRPEEYVALLRIAKHSDGERPESVCITETPPQFLQRDHVTVMEGSICGDVLRLLVSHAGGCGDHAFRLYMQPTFMESYPVQANLYLQHVSIDDFCEAMITSEPSFDIRPIAELYAHFYGGYDDIVLNVFGYLGKEPPSRISVTYSPR